MINIYLSRYERFEKNQVQVKQSNQGAIRKSGPIPASVGVSSSAKPPSLMDAPLIDFSAASEAPPSFSQVPSMAHFPVS